MRRPGQQKALPRDLCLLSTGQTNGTIQNTQPHARNRKLVEEIPVVAGDGGHHGDGSRPDKPACRQLEDRSEEHTSELQSPDHLVCRLLLEKKKCKISSIRSRRQMLNYVLARTSRESVARSVL